MSTSTSAKIVNFKRTFTSATIILAIFENLSLCSQINAGVTPHPRSFYLEQMKAITESHTMWTKYRDQQIIPIPAQAREIFNITSGPGNITEEGGKIVGVRDPGSLLRLSLRSRCMNET